VIVVADGSGGSPRGAHAAETVIGLIRRSVASDQLDAVEVLRECDLRIARSGSGGETTAVVTIVSEGGIIGASVGDSEAWLLDANSVVDLTASHIRKPLIGTGHVEPIPFVHGPLSATLLLGSDGLFKYGNVARIREIASANDIDEIPERLVASVRLRSGSLQDDTTAIVCRRL
jgi:serine/threonine protein phosphatase PrpC